MTTSMLEAWHDEFDRAISEDDWAGAVSRADLAAMRSPGAVLDTAPGSVLPYQTFLPAVYGKGVIASLLEHDEYGPGVARMLTSGAFRQ